MTRQAEWERVKSIQGFLVYRAKDSEPDQLEAFKAVVRAALLTPELGAKSFFFVIFWRGFYFDHFSGISVF
jgi:hypothetical protein